jgi:hypothetical protein
MRHNLASRNCNCSKTKLKEVNNLVAQGHPTERCWKLTCENDARCKSFGIWFGKNMRGETIFHCASFDSECPENENGAVAGTKCPVPELMPRWNLAFNKLPIQWNLTALRCLKGQYGDALQTLLVNRFWWSACSWSILTSIPECVDLSRTAFWKLVCTGFDGVLAHG